MFTREFLLEVRRQTLCRWLWYSALDRLERGILSILVKIIDGVKSRLLSVQLVNIIAKLKDACKSGFMRHLELFSVERVHVVQAKAIRC